MLLQEIHDVFPWRLGSVLAFCPVRIKLPDVCACFQKLLHHLQDKPQGSAMHQRWQADIHQNANTFRIHAALTYTVLCYGRSLCMSGMSKIQPGEVVAGV